MCSGGACETMNLGTFSCEADSQKTTSKELTTKSSNGGAIKLKIITHSKERCKEFVVESPKFSLKRWLMWSIVVYVIGCYLQLDNRDIWIMVYVAAILLVIIFIKLHFKVKKESLLVMASIGVQLTTTFASGRTTSMFYDMANIRDIVINEAITMHRVIYYLAILLNRCPSAKDTITSLVPLYTHSWPALRCLLLIRTEIAKVLKAGSRKVDPL